MRQQNLNRIKIWQFLLVTLVCILPLLPLVDIKAKFYFDWNNFLWFAAYFGEYFRQHFSFPSVFNTHQGVGFSLPLFYSFGFSSVVGIISALVGSVSAAFRIITLLLFFAQYLCVFYLFKSQKQKTWLCHVFAILVTWAIYPMTNLFNRSALTEFYATTLFSIGVCSWILALSPTSKKYFWFLTSGLTFILAAYSHPITALLGGVFFLPLWMWSIFTADSKKGVVQWSTALAVTALVILSPWLYTYIKFDHSLLIQNQISTINFIPGVDHWLTRITPFPYDPRVNPDPYSGTPHLDAQINLPLFIFSIFFFVNLIFQKNAQSRKYSSLLCLMGLMTLGFFIASICPEIWPFLPKIFNTIQFPSRLVTYINLGLLLVLYAQSCLLKNELKNRFVLMIAIFAVGLGLFGVALKYNRAIQTPKFELAKGLISRHPLALLDAPYDGPYNAYSTPSFFKVASFKTHVEEVKIPLDESEKKFGETKDVLINFNTQRYVQTNIFAFPWNSVLIDGIRADTDSLFIQNSNLGLFVPEGEHTIGYLFTPSLTWIWLYHISNTTLFCFFILTLLVGFYKKSGFIGSDFSKLL